MGNTDVLVLLGIALIGGWCFFMGPCKGWLSNLGGNNDASARIQLNRAFNNPNMSSNYKRDAVAVFEGRMTYDEALSRNRAEAQRLGVI